MRSILARDELEQRYPIYQESKVLDFVKAMAHSAKHIALCLEHRYEEAFLQANSETAIEEIAETQGVLGNFDDAIETARNRVTPVDRQIGAFIVIVVELLQHGRFKLKTASLECKFSLYTVV